MFDQVSEDHLKLVTDVIEKSETGGIPNDCVPCVGEVAVYWCSASTVCSAQVSFRLELLLL